MPHTFGVRKVSRWPALAAALIVLSTCAAAQPAKSWTDAIRHAAGSSPDARIVVLDLAGGRVLASQRLDEAARTLAAPGSTLKPLVLYGLLSQGRWNPERRVSCDRRLVIAGHRLACTHPQAPAFDAGEALTWSCNSYFAEMARALGPGELGSLLRLSGLLSATGLARNEATAEFHEPATTEAAQLAVLGVEGVRVTPLELATAYRWLAQELAGHSDTAAARTVRAGLEDTTAFGMAREANIAGVQIAGKTGTAEGAQSSRTHGWFAGFAPAGKPQVVIAVYLPQGRGADAAHVAGVLLADAPLEKQ
jgi:cell division protein FtsI/penicillin-binding protein 2